MADRNHVTEVVLRMTRQLRDIRERSAKAPGPPFMMEEVSLSTYRNRVNKMTPEERLAEAQRMGMAEFLRVMGEGS